MTNIFSNAKFAEEYKTTNNKRAIFLRFAENSEGQYAFFYVEDWGTVQVFVDSGKEVHGDIEHNILPFKREQPNDNLDEAAKEYSWSPDNKRPINGDKYDAFKAGAKWDREQGVVEETRIITNPYNHLKGVVVTLGLESLDFEDNESVIVQIRKKEE